MPASRSEERQQALAFLKALLRTAVQPDFHPFQVLSVQQSSSLPPVRRSKVQHRAWSSLLRSWWPRLDLPAISCQCRDLGGRSGSGFREELGCSAKWFQYAKWRTSSLMWRVSVEKKRRSQRRTRHTFQNVKTYSTASVNVGMVDFGQEANCERVYRVAVWNKHLQSKYAACTT